MQVWDLGSGNAVVSLAQKVFTRDNWPTMQFVDDESLAFYTVTNSVTFYNCKDWAAGEGAGQHGGLCVPKPRPTLEPMRARAAQERV